MAISKTQSTSAVMVTGGNIDQINPRVGHTVVHCHGEITIVDTVGMLVNHHISFGSTHRSEVGLFAKDDVLGAGEITQPIIPRVHRLAHRNAAHAGVASA